MIIVFILLGLGFLCGGVAAIVDGLPYMVLERGFTQVIIGTVVAVAGVLMLALSWVLVEIRRLKQTLSNAAMAMSVASAFAGPASERDPASPHAEVRSDDSAAGVPPAAPAAGIGALAGAGAVLAATQALGAPARQEPLHQEPAEASQEPADKPAEPRSSGGDTAEHAGEQAGLRADEAPVVPEATREPDVDAIPAFDPFRPIDPQGVPEFEAQTRTFDAGVEPVGSTAPLAEIASISESERDAVEPAAEASTETPADDGPAVPAAPGPSDIDDPFERDLVSATSRDADTARTARETDEFGLLRESLTALRLEVEPAGGRIEPSFSGIDGGGASSTEGAGRSLDDLAAAGNWMEPALQRRAPWFGDTGEKPREEAPHDEKPGEDVAQPETAPEPAWPATSWPEPVWLAPEPEAPLWPPQTREATAFEPEPEPAAPAAASEEPARDAAAFEEAPPFVPEIAPAEADVPESAEPEPTAPDADGAEPSTGATSDEGIVGAYQVGEAHFTIYADGSIQARTPDGDYSFTSMDELKIYLASEKSRLGV